MRGCSLRGCSLRGDCSAREFASLRGACSDRASARGALAARSGAFSGRRGGRPSRRGSSRRGSRCPSRGASRCPSRRGSRFRSPRSPRFWSRLRKRSCRASRCNGRSGGAGDAGFGADATSAVTTLLPNNHSHTRTKIPFVGWGAITTGAGRGVGSGAASGVGIGTIGAAEAGSMLGTSGASLGGFLSRLPMLESSSTG